MRARELGIAVGTGRPGPYNAITDVRGVRVGVATLIDGEGPLVVGQGPIRTGVTVIVPHDGNVWEEPLFAGCHRLNGNGELTGLEWIRESGLLMSAVALTNTHSVGVVRDALVARAIAAHDPRATFWALPVVGETYDGTLNDINGLHVTAAHVEQAVAAASDGAVAEGNVGGGTGMICHGFKGGTGTASRVVAPEAGGYTVGVLVQANHGRRERLAVNGVPVGRAIPPDVVPLPRRPAAPAASSETQRDTRETPDAPEGGGSIIAIVATDAPLLPHQCTRLAQRAGLGIARTGGVGEHFSGDLFLAFSTANRGLPGSQFGVHPVQTHSVTMLSNWYISALFDAVVEATEEAILNALLAAETMAGRDGITAHRLDPERLLAAMARYGHQDSRQ